MKRLSRILAVFACLLLVAGCGSHKNQSVTPSEVMSADRVREVMMESSGEWTSLYLPVKVSVSGPASVSLSGRATLIRDKEVYISFRMIGMEVASVYLNQDSVYLVDKYHRMMFAESVESVARNCDLNISNIQDVLLGVPTVPGWKGLSREAVGMFSVSQAPGTLGDMMYVAESDIDGVSYSYSYVLTAFNDAIAVSLLSLEPHGGRAVVCMYGDPVLTPAGVMESRARVRASAGKSDVNVEIDWNFGSAEWNTSRTVTWKRPRGYKEINAEMLLKMLKI